MSQPKNYYQILHVQPDAPSEVIRSTYRTMMQKLKMHPDLGGDEESAALLNEAYAVLMDDAARKAYDESLLESSQEVPASHHSQGEERQTKVVKPYVYDPNQCAFCLVFHPYGSSVQHDKSCSQCGSALYPATKFNFGSDGQRIIQRIDKQWPVFFYTKWPQSKPHQGDTQDVSLNGMQIITSVSLQPEQIIKVTSRNLEAVARVVNQREDHSILRKRWRVGLEFLTLRFHQTQGTFIRVDA